MQQLNELLKGQRTRNGQNHRGGAERQNQGPVSGKLRLKRCHTVRRVNGGSGDLVP